MTNQLKYIREKLGMKQEALAMRAGTSQGKISEIESGKCEPNVYLALRIAQALDTTVEEMFGERSERD